jgi:hypothetical protein
MICRYRAKDALDSVRFPIALILCVGLIACRSGFEASPAPQTGIFDAESANYYRGLHASLVQRGTPTDRLLAVMSRSFFVDGSPVSGEPSSADLELLDSAIRDAPSDPMLIWFVASIAPGRDAPPSLVPRLEALEADNGAIGMLMLAEAMQSDDPLLVTEAIERIGKGRRFDEHIGDLMIAWLDAVHRYPLTENLQARAGSDLSSIALGQALAWSGAFGFPAYQDLTTSCSSAASAAAGAARDRACLGAAEAMIRGSGSFISRAIGNALLRRFDQARYESNRRMFEYQTEQFAKIWPGSPTAAQQSLLIEQDWRATRSELRVMERALQRAGISPSPPDDWVPEPAIFHQKLSLHRPDRTPPPAL